MRLRLFWLAACLAAPSAWAESNSDALQWLHRVAVSAQSLTYSGTFIYQCGPRTESSRVSHVVEDNLEMEHLVMLDGSPREMARVGDEVRTWLPEQRRIVIERRIPRPRFPAVLPRGLAELTDYYNIRRGPPDRVAGFDAQPVSIEPRDDLRFARRLWIDRKTGLLLKSVTFGSDGQPLESSVFTQLTLGGPVDRDAIRARFYHLDPGWRVQDVRSAETGSDDGRWVLRAVSPGFRQVASVNRQLQNDSPESSQLVFSDGLASISVFFEPLILEMPPPALGQFTMGALNVYKRRVGNYLLVLVGDVPASALKKFGDGIEMRKH